MKIAEGNQVYINFTHIHIDLDTLSQCTQTGNNEYLKNVIMTC
jgi:hypothetical protein